MNRKNAAVIQDSEKVFSKACKEISQILLSTDFQDGQTQNQIKKVCAKYSLDRLPRKYEILATVKGLDFEKLRRRLQKKPVKTSSGVAIVALMPRPYACPHGRCTYCPGGVEYNSPNSYTGKEPSTINAIENAFDPKKQIASKLEKLITYGHDPSKLELVIVGGTFLFMSHSYQEDFIKSCFDALNGYNSNSLEEAKSNNEHANIRNVGFTVETKPDYCKEDHVDLMLNYGITRVEIGVQTLRERVYKIVNRGHNFQDVTDSFRIAKDAGYKIVAHMMPGLPSMTPKEDISDFKQLFENHDLKPDMLKIYPSLVLENTPLYESYKNGDYKPYSQDDMIKVLTEVKKTIPDWVRIMRVQREISSSDIVDGPKFGNLRQIVHKKLESEGKICRCIRCREAGSPKTKAQLNELNLKEYTYASSEGEEVFLSYEDKNDKVYGFLRLRKPSNKAHRKEITDSDCIVRELHVYGKSIRIGAREETQIQHSGLGKKLMNKAESIAKEKFDAKRLFVISAVGTREYYQKLGYGLYGPYMVKVLTNQA